VGYYSDFEVSVSGLKGKDEAEWFEFKAKKAIQYTFENGFHCNIADGSGHFRITEAKWYDCDKDLLDLSLAFPHLLIEVYGQGEESGDVWKARYRNGEGEKATSTIVFEKFKKIT